MSIKVRATEVLFYGLKRERPGNEFLIQDFIEFSPVGMEFVHEEDAEKYDLMRDEIVERKKAIKQAVKDKGLEPVVSKKNKAAAPKPLHEKAPSSKKKSEVI